MRPKTTTWPGRGQNARRGKTVAVKAPMLLVKTYLDKSPIHGLGVFAAERLPKGTKIWRFVEGFDRCYTPQQFAKLPKAARDFLKNYAYRVDGEILFTVDNDHHMNHDENPNTLLRGGYVIAATDIPKGAEITNDYREFDPALCAAFLKKPANGKALNGGKAMNGKAMNGALHAKANGKSNGGARARR